MRNEIFSQIKQNRKRFYSELKTTEVKTSKPETEVKEHSNKISEKNNNIEADKFNINPKISTQKFHFNFKPILQFGNSFSDHTLKILKKGNAGFDKLNQSLIESTGKITQWFYEVSSGFFEDPNDFEEFSDEMNFRSSQNSFNERSGTLNFIGINQTGTMALDASYLTSQERFLLWLNKQYQKIVLFFESDELAEIKIVKSPKIVPKEIYFTKKKSNINTSFTEMSTIIKSNESRRKKTISFYKLITFILKHPVFISMNILSTVEIIMIIGKKALLTIFPIINRFI